MWIEMARKCHRGVQYGVKSPTLDDIGQNWPKLTKIGQKMAKKGILQCHSHLPEWALVYYQALVQYRRHFHSPQKTPKKGA